MYIVTVTTKADTTRFYRISFPKNWSFVSSYFRYFFYMRFYFRNPSWPFITMLIRLLSKTNIYHSTGEIS